LQIAAEYDKAIVNGMSHAMAIARLKQGKNAASLRILEALQLFKTDEKESLDSVRRLYIQELRIGMLLDENVLTETGTLLASKGQEISHTTLLRLKNFMKTQGIREPILIRIKNR
jgi:hypothetical protein